VRGSDAAGPLSIIKSPLATENLAIAVGNQILRKIVQVASGVVEVLCFTGKDLLYMKLWNSSGQGNVKETSLAVGIGLKIMLLRNNNL
jgi:hypothetical protein